MNTVRAVACQMLNELDGARPVFVKYNANYYGAFVRDLDGNKIEAVTLTAKEVL